MALFTDNAESIAISKKKKLWLSFLHVFLILIYL